MKEVYLRQSPFHEASLPSSFRIQGRNSNTESKPQVPSSKAQEPAGRSRALASCKAAGTKGLSVWVSAWQHYTSPRDYLVKVGGGTPEREREECMAFLNTFGTLLRAAPRPPPTRA